MEFLHGRPLSPAELEMLRRQIEEGSDSIAQVDDERHRRSQLALPLLEKLPPVED